MKKISLSLFLFLSFCMILTVTGLLFVFIYSGVESIKISESIKKMQVSVISLFVDNIKKDIKFGNYADVYNKCNRLAHEDNVVGVVISDYNNNYICNLGIHSKNVFFRNIYFDSTQINVAAEVKVYFSPVNLSHLGYESLKRLLKVLFLVLTLSFVLVYIFVGKTMKGVGELSEYLKNLNFEGIKKIKMENSNIREVYNLSVSVSQMFDQLEHLKQDQVKYEKEKAVLRISKVIAHDIRSPLEALRSVTGYMSDLDFQHRKIILSSIQRISDIANGLLRERKEEEALSLLNINILLDELYQDKVFEHSSKISFNNELNYKDSFVKGVENALYRVFSNLINNAFESYEDTNGEVSIVLEQIDSNIFVKIIDSGKGMQAELIKKVLQGGVTTKEKGNGLGVSSALIEIEKHNGKLEIDSVIGQGTTIKVSLPKVETPSWFVDEIEVDETSNKIVCVDDDPCFLELYQEKLKGTGKDVECINIKNIEQLDFSLDSQFFFDYDLGKEKTGLDIILEQKISSKATLVTSMYQDEKIQNICKEHGIKIIPKQIFNSAPVVNRKEQSDVTQVVFIDDDELMHLSWKMEASKNNVAITTYFNVDQFLEDSESYNKNTKIYIDSHLGEDIKGEVESKKIAEKGFTEIYLATGYSKKDIEKPEWIKDVVGKRPIFS